MFSDLLIKLFVPNYQNVNDVKVRSRYGVLAGVFGIICNCFLAGIKLVIGTLTGVFSIAADAVNNLSDMASSVVTLIGFKISKKSADSEHPYGHGRAEYISGFVVSAAVIAVALELFRTSIQNIIHKNEIDVNVTVIIILAATILVKCAMSLFYFKISKKISSAAMKATATDSLSDCITTGVALISVAVMLIFGINIDGIAGAIVSIFVMISGFSTAMETISLMLGESPDKALVEKIEKIALASPELLGVHDIRIHEYGPGRTFATMDVELPRHFTLDEAHDIITKIEKQIKAEEIVSEITIHLDPVAIDDEERLPLLNFMLKILTKLDSRIKIHDFRIHRSEDKKWPEFDMVTPYKEELSDQELCDTIQKELAANFPDFSPAVVHIDRE